MKKTLILSSILTLLILFGCSKNYVGIYINENKPKEYLELKEDKTFYLIEHDSEMTGNYVISDDILTLKLSSGQAAKGKIEGNRIIDDDKNIWIKK